MLDYSGELDTLALKSVSDRRNGNLTPVSLLHCKDHLQSQILVNVVNVVHLKYIPKNPENISYPIHRSLFHMFTYIDIYMYYAYI